MNEIQCVVETAVYADDLDAAPAFYRDVLGLELGTHDKDRHVFFRVGPASMLLVFRAEATLKGDILHRRRRDGPGHFAFGIPAGSLDYWRERLARHGVGGREGGGVAARSRSLYFRDPAGNAVEVLTPGLWGLASGW